MGGSGKMATVLEKKSYVKTVFYFQTILTFVVCCKFDIGVTKFHDRFGALTTDMEPLLLIWGWCPPNWPPPNVKWNVDARKRHNATKSERRKISINQGIFAWNRFRFSAHFLSFWLFDEIFSISDESRDN